MIAAMDEKRGIGKKNQLPWRLPSDLKRFKRLTMGHHLVMGRKTYESIGRQLPGRISIVLSRDPNYEVAEGILVRSLDEALKIANEGGESEVFIIGGGELFEGAIDIVDRIYLTKVHAQVECDTYFPKLDPIEWRISEIIYQPADEMDLYAYTFQIMERMKEDCSW